MITLVNISPEAYPVSRSYFHRIVIPAAPAGGYSTFPIEDSKDAKVFWQSLSEKEVVPVTITAKEIVADLLVSGEGLEPFGVFALPEGRTTPTEAELDAARARRRQTLISRVEDGDRAFSQFGVRGIQHIPDMCKRAVRELGEMRDWVFNPIEGAKTECPVCGALLRNLSNGQPPAICRECQSILDPKRVSEHRPTEAPKRRPGRPKREKPAEPVTV